jgi:hypothetical protein
MPKKTRSMGCHRQSKRSQPAPQPRRRAVSLSDAPLDRIDETIAALRATGVAHLLPLFEACRDYGFGLALIFQNCGPFSLTSSGPTVALVGDDPPPPAEATGPAGFSAPSMKRLRERPAMS